MVWISHYNVIENFDFQKLARSDEITGNFDVRLGWGRITALPGKQRSLVPDGQPVVAELVVTDAKT